MPIVYQDVNVYALLLTTLFSYLQSGTKAHGRIKVHPSLFLLITLKFLSSLCVADADVRLSTFIAPFSESPISL